MAQADIDPGALEPDALAAEVARRMWADDRASQALGMEILAVRAGYARLRMPVRRDMTNGHGICHGGYMFLLADSTFAFACNSHNQRAVAASAEIHFLASAHEGDVLTAEDVEQHVAGRSGVYDMRVTDQNGRLIALFRGKSATIKGRFIEPSTDSPVSDEGAQP
ncbi:MAG: hydroxyphenylacetyl-CoA thioesterase PaaI [Burkholderiaceae bacterium]